MTVGVMSVGEITVGVMTVGEITVGVMTVGVMTVGVMTVGVMTVGVMTVGVMTVGVMRRPPKNKTVKYIYQSKNSSLCVNFSLISLELVGLTQVG